MLEAKLLIVYFGDIDQINNYSDNLVVPAICATREHQGNLRQMCDPSRLAEDYVTPKASETHECGPLLTTNGYNEKFSA